MNDWRLRAGIILAIFLLGVYAATNIPEEAVVGGVSVQIIILAPILAFFLYILIKKPKPTKLSGKDVTNKSASNKETKQSKENGKQVCDICGEKFGIMRKKIESSHFETSTNVCSKCIEGGRVVIKCEECDDEFTTVINNAKNDVLGTCPFCRIIKNVISKDFWPKRKYTNKSLDINNIEDEIKDYFMGELSAYEVDKKEANDWKVLAGGDTIVILEGDPNDLLVTAYVPIDYEKLTKVKGDFFSGEGRHFLRYVPILGSGSLKAAPIMLASKALGGDYTSKNKAQKKAKAEAESVALKHADNVIEKIDNIIKENIKSSKNETNQQSISHEIRKLQELKDDGVITQEEFDAKKKELLSRM